jgi:hypothetical protein
VEDEIRLEPSKTLEEKRKMMDMLKRFEDSAEEALAAQLQGVDIGESGQQTMEQPSQLNSYGLADSASPEALWSALNEKQRAAFMEAVKDSSSPLARQLLESAKAQHEFVLPWWEAPIQLEDDEDQLLERERYGRRPSITIEPPKLIQKPSMPEAQCGPSLLYNILALR